MAHPVDGRAEAGRVTPAAPDRYQGRAWSIVLPWWLVWVSGVLVSALSAALLWHFLNIWRYGEHLIREPNRLVLALETVGLLLVLGFGVALLTMVLRRLLAARKRDMAMSASARRALPNVTAESAGGES